MRIRPITKPTASVRKIASSGFSRSADTKKDIITSVGPRVLRRDVSICPRVTFARPPWRADGKRRGHPRPSPISAARRRLDSYRRRSAGSWWLGACWRRRCAAMLRKRSCAATLRARPRVAVELVVGRSVRRRRTRRGGRPTARGGAVAGLLRAGLRARADTGFRPVHVAPAAAAVGLLPAVARLLVDVAVAAGVDVAATRARDGARCRRARACCARRPSPPPLPCVTRVVVPVRLLVTRDVCAQSSPR